MITDGFTSLYATVAGKAKQVKKAWQMGDTLGRFYSSRPVVDIFEDLWTAVHETHMEYFDVRRQRCEDIRVQSLNYVDWKKLRSRSVCE